MVYQQNVKSAKTTSALRSPDRVDTLHERGAVRPGRLSTLVTVASELPNLSALLLPIPDVAQEVEAVLVFFRFLTGLFGLPEIVFEIGLFDRQGQRV